MSVGTFNRIGLDVTAESAFGTVLTPYALDKSYPVRADRPVYNYETVNDQDTLTGQLENGITSIVTKITASQTVEMDARLDAIAAYGKFAFGKLTTTAGTPNTHLIEVGSTADERALPSFTNFWFDALNASGKWWILAGSKIQRMTIAGEAGGKITMSLDIMSGKPVDASTYAQVQDTITGPAMSTDPILAMARVSSFKIISGGADIKDKLKSFEFVFENVFDDAAEMGAGSLMVPAMERIGFNVSGSFTLKADALAATSGGTALSPSVVSILDTYMAPSATAASLGHQTGVKLELIMAGATSGHQAKVTVYNAKLADGSVAGQRGKLEKPITFVGMYDTTATKAADIEVKNTVANYT
jgi:hypothetical protein